MSEARDKHLKSSLWINFCFTVEYWNRAVTFYCLQAFLEICPALLKETRAKGPILIATTLGHIDSREKATTAQQHVY